MIWLACHVAHRTRRSDVGVTDRESSILAFVSAAPGLRATELAAHLGIGRASLSAQIHRLEKLELVMIKPGGNRRERRIALTAAGERVAQAGSPLDSTRVARVLKRVSPADRIAAVRGLELLAAASMKGTESREERAKERRARENQ